jgi:hypothetical protein
VHHRVEMTFLVRFHAVTATSMNMTAFWDMASCSLVEVDQRLRGGYWSYHRPDDGGSNVSTFQLSVQFYVSTWRNVILYILCKVLQHQRLYFPKIYNHRNITVGPFVSGASIDPTSQVRSSAKLRPKRHDHLPRKSSLVSWLLYRAF